MSIVLQGSTSGSVTLQEPAVAGTTVLTLPAVTGTVLTTTSPKAGNVIQVVQGTTNTQVSISGTTAYTDSGLSASIIPSSSSSKILITVNQQVYIYRATGSVTAGVRLLRNSTTIFSPFTDPTGPLEPYLEAGNSNAFYYSYRHPIVFLDSPATTSSVTYKTQGALRNTANSQVLVFQASDTISGTSTITLMEIAA